MPGGSVVTAIPCRGVQIWKFCNRIGSEFFHKLHIQSETAQSVAHEPKYLAVSILPHEAKVMMAILFSSDRIV